MQQVVVPRQIRSKQHAHVGRHPAQGSQGRAKQDDLVGDVALGEALENDLRAQAADLQVLWQACGELDQLVVEERHAGLDTGSHAHPVALDQDVVHQSGMNVAIKEAIESAAAAAG